MFLPTTEQLLQLPYADTKLDTDDPEHIQWLYSVALERAKEFKIEGVTWSLTQGVVKNIIPAIASTNAIIAGKPHHSCQPVYSNIHIFVASCCNEAFKIATSSAAYLNNYFMLIGTEGVYSYTFEYEKRKDCPVCGVESLEVSIPESWTVERLIEMLVEKQDMWVLMWCLFPILFDVSPARSRSLRCRRRRNTSTSRPRPSLRK